MFACTSYDKHAMFFSDYFYGVVVEVKFSLPDEFPNGVVVSFKGCLDVETPDAFASCFKPPHVILLDGVKLVLISIGFEQILLSHQILTRIFLRTLIISWGCLYLLLRRSL